jgi:CIC family chloride channel protein
MMDGLFLKMRDGVSKTGISLIPREHFFMILMGAIVGGAVGYGAIGFRGLIGVVAQSGWGLLAGLEGRDLFEMALAAPLWVKVLMPAAGGLIVGLIISFVSQEAKGHGVPEVIEAVALRDGRMSSRMVLGDALASATCIGTGGSVGVHGPIVLIGSAIGSVIGRVAKITGGRLRTLVACGAAGGIAATFNAPMAGALFSLEIILSEFAALEFIPIVVSSVIATALSRHYLGNFPAFEVPPYDLLHFSEFFLYLILGVFAGLVAYSFIRLLYSVGDLFDRFKLPNFTKPALGGAVVGCIGIFFPEIFGVGYESVTKVLRGETVGTILIWLLAAKILATSFTLGSGGSGGIFAPALFMGAVLGGAFGQFAHILFPETTALSGAYALVAMGAVFAGTTRAPITAMLIIFEMTANYRIILPLMFACTISLVISALLSRESIYTLKLVRRGVNIYGGKELNVLRGLKVSQVMLPVIEQVSPSASLTEVVSRMMGGSHSHLYVVGKENRILGHISLENLRPILNDYDTLGDVVIASDLMDSSMPVVSPEESLDMVMQLFGKFNLNEIPVVDEGQLVGTVCGSDVIETYNREVLKLDMASGLATSLRLQQKIHSDRLALVGGFLILEVAAPNVFVGKSLETLDLRERFGATILTIKRRGEEEEEEDRVAYLLPKSTTKILAGDTLIIFGLQKDLAHFPRD